MTKTPGTTPRRAAAAVAAILLASCGSGGGGGDGGPGGVVITPGTADLTVDAQAAEDSLVVVERFFPADDCAVVEGAVDSPGVHRLLLFDTVIVNYGEEDVVIGSPADPLPPLVPGDFEFSPCHGHYHFTGFAEYELLDASGDVVGFGHKQAFCLVDSIRYVEGAPGPHTSCDFQGISSGWADIYDRTLDGQWVDVTGLPGGDYTLRITVNANGKLRELPDLHANTVTVELTLPPP
jgi:hypothetical protein